MENNLVKIDRIARLLPGFLYLYNGPADSTVIRYLMEKNYCLETADPEVVFLAQSLGMKPGDVYFHMGADPTPQQIEACFGKCRFVAGKLSHMKMIDDVVAKRMQEASCKDSNQPCAPIEAIGIHVIPDTYASDGLHGFQARKLAGMAAQFRQLKHVSVTGCFVQGSLRRHSPTSHSDNTAFCKMIHGAILGNFFRACYETAKLVSVSLPCGMVYVNMAGCVEALWQNDAYHPETLQAALCAAEIVKHQNETAFYARLLLS